MGWRELRGWLAAMNRRVAAEHGSPESWSGTENDPGWQEMRAKRRRMQGH